MIGVIALEVFEQDKPINTPTFIHALKLRGEYWSVRRAIENGV